MNDHINALKKKSADSYTSEEIAAIKIRMIICAAKSQSVTRR